MEGEMQQQELPTDSSFKSSPTINVNSKSNYSCFNDNYIGTVNGIPMSKVSNKLDHNQLKIIKKKSETETIPGIEKTDVVVGIGVGVGLGTGTKTKTITDRFHCSKNPGLPVFHLTTTTGQDVDSNLIPEAMNTLQYPLYASVPAPEEDERQRELYDFIIKLNKQGRNVLSDTDFALYKKLREKQQQQQQPEQQQFSNHLYSHSSDPSTSWTMPLLPLTILELKKQVDEINLALRKKYNYNLDLKSQDPILKSAKPMTDIIDTDLDLHVGDGLDLVRNLDIVDEFLHEHGSYDAAYGEWILLSHSHLHGHGEADDPNSEFGGKIPLGRKIGKNLISGSSRLKATRCQIM